MCDPPPNMKTVFITSTRETEKINTRETNKLFNKTLMMLCAFQLDTHDFDMAYWDCLPISIPNHSAKLPFAARGASLGDRVLVMVPHSSCQWSPLSFCLITASLPMQLNENICTHFSFLPGCHKINIIFFTCPETLFLAFEK